MSAQANNTFNVPIACHVLDNNGRTTKSSWIIVRRSDCSDRALCETKNKDACRWNECAKRISSTKQISHSRPRETASSANWVEGNDRLWSCMHFNETNDSDLQGIRWGVHAFKSHWESGEMVCFWKWYFGVRFYVAHHAVLCLEDLLGSLDLVKNLDFTPGKFGFSLSRISKDRGRDWISVLLWKRVANICSL